MSNAPFNFGGLEPEYSEYKNAAIAVLPIPFDKTSTWIKGADKGPRALIDASRNLELYDIETDSEVYTRGIFTAPAVRARDSLALNEKVHAQTARFLRDGKFVVGLGGEHSVTFGIVKAFAERHPSLSVLHLDAHSDMRDEYHGNRFSHACIMRRVREITKKTVSVGIRSMDSSEREALDRNRIYFAEDIHSSDEWMAGVLRKLSAEVYVTIDLDVFDPSIMPSTGTPEPGGLQWYQVLKLLKMVAGRKKVVGFDVVELCPSSSKAPDFLAAKLAYKLLSYSFASRRGEK